MIESYFAALEIDLKTQLKFAQNLGKFKKINSVFIGGGTPNMADSKFYKNIFKILESNLEQNCEISIESNPNLLTKNWLNDMQKMGVNRLSMGVQSFFSDKLALLERNHSPQDVTNALNIAQNSIENFSIDLIFDCKIDSFSRLEQELEMAVKLAPAHISAYSLSLDSNSKFGDSKRQDLLVQNAESSLDSNGQNIESFGYFVRDFLGANGFLQYEVSNYARLKKCTHNLCYWRGDEYLGVGAGGVGRLDSMIDFMESNLVDSIKDSIQDSIKNKKLIHSTRYSGIKNIESYIKNPLLKHKEFLSQNDINFEQIFLGFRSEVGVPHALCNPQKAEILLQENMCHKKGDKIYANDYFLGDSLSLFVM